MQRYDMHFYQALVTRHQNRYCFGVVWVLEGDVIKTGIGALRFVLRCSRSPTLFDLLVVHPFVIIFSNSNIDPNHDDTRHDNRSSNKSNNNSSQHLQTLPSRFVGDLQDSKTLNLLLMASTCICLYIHHVLRVCEGTEKNRKKSERVTTIA